MAADGPTLQQSGEFAVIARLVGTRTTCRCPDRSRRRRRGGRRPGRPRCCHHRHARRRQALPPDWSTPHDVGRKAVAQNAADIEAMGARVTAFVVAFGAPADTPVSAAEAPHRRHVAGSGRRGCRDRRWRPGGQPQWVGVGHGVGDLGGRAPVLRGGARPGAVIAVAGELGRSAAGLALCTAEWVGLRRLGGVTGCRARRTVRVG